jgi:hypothetical protein
MRGEKVSPNIWGHILGEIQRQGFEPEENSPLIMKRIHGESERRRVKSRIYPAQSVETFLRFRVAFDTSLSYKNVILLSGSYDKIVLSQFTCRETK